MPPGNSSPTILVVDDDRGMLRLIEKALRREGFNSVPIASGRDAIEWATGRSADLMLLDLKLPDIEAGELISHLESIHRPIPFVIITGQGDERVAVAMMKRGALDYLIKDVNFIEFIPTVVRRALAQIGKERRLQAAEEQARLADTALAQSYSGVMITTAGSDDPEIVYVNDAFADVTGTSAKKLLGRRLHELEALSGQWQAFRKVLTTGKTFFGELSFRHAGGQVRFADCTIIGVRAPGSQVNHWTAILHDVTGRKRAEEELRKSASRLYNTLDNMIEGCQIISLDWKYLYVNGTAARHSRRTVDELLGHTITECFPGIEQTDVFEILRRCMEDRSPCRTETGFVFPDGSKTDFDLSIQPVPEGILILSYDVTSRKLAEDEVRCNERALSDFFNLAPVGLLWVGPGGTILRINQAQLELLGHTANEILGHRLAEFKAGRELASIASAHEATGETIKNHKALIRSKDGSVRHVLVDVNGIRDGETWVRSNWFVRDITRRVELEHEILDVSERERRRFGQELHDDLCQTLTGIAFRCESLAQELAESSRCSPRKVEVIGRMIRAATSRARELARGLSPNPVSTDGLDVALKELAERSRKLFQVNCRLITTDNLPVLDEATGIQLYRIAQEAVGNAIKHGRPKHLEIRLTKSDQQLTLEVNDDGRGLPKRPRKTRGMGLHVMRYRAGIIGGTLDVRRRPAGGTSVVCSLVT